MWWFVFYATEWETEWEEEVQRAGTAGASGTDVQQKGWMPGFIILFFFRHCALSHVPRHTGHGARDPGVLLLVGAGPRGLDDLPGSPVGRLE